MGAADLRDVVVARQRELATRHDVLGRAGRDPSRYEDLLLRVFDATNDLIRDLDRMRARSARRRLLVAGGLLVASLVPAGLVGTGRMPVQGLVVTAVAIAAAFVLWLTARAGMPNTPARPAPPNAARPKGPDAPAGAVGPNASAGEDGSAAPGAPARPGTPDTQARQAEPAASVRPAAPAAEPLRNPPAPRTSPPSTRDGRFELLQGELVAPDLPKPRRTVTWQDDSEAGA
ncbi:hypothetical protein [Actinoplanes sp. NPDC049681]|uniref:hypothetical protein n=1 Tax=Actinoplanes sp. NPDC049681 TaxID=3363905 RepID=UPI0037BA2A53